MKTLKLTLLCCICTFAPFVVDAVDVQSTGSTSTDWISDTNTSLTVALALQNNPGNLFASISFDLLLFVDDSESQTLRPFGSILLPDGSNPDVFLSTTYLRADSLVDENQGFDVLTDFISENLLQNNAVDGTDNYLGISFKDVNAQQHYGWLQIELHQYSDGSIAANYLSGYVNDAPETAATTGAVPEPSALVLFGGSALAGLALIARSRRMRQN